MSWSYPETSLTKYQIFSKNTPSFLKNNKKITVCIKNAIAQDRKLVEIFFCYRNFYIFNTKNWLIFLLWKIRKKSKLGKYVPTSFSCVTSKLGPPSWCPGGRRLRPIILFPLKNHTPEVFLETGEETPSLKSLPSYLFVLRHWSIDVCIF